MYVQVGNSQGGYCDGVTRRQALKVGGTGLFAGLSLPHLLALEENAPASRRAKAKSCIFLWLEGGPSHIDMWDLKSDAPREIRGPYKKIATSVPGLQVGELMHRSAKIADKYTLIRSHSHRDNGHQTGFHWVMTGYPPAFGDGGARGMPYNEFYPSIGSIVSREIGAVGSVPPYVNLPNPLGAGGPGFYGPSYSPFVIETDPVEPDFEVRDLNVVKGIGEKRFRLRRDLLRGVESLVEQNRNVGRAKAMSTYYEKAFNLVTSPEAKRAFEITQESSKTREMYGYTSLGQSALLARRLVESGCRFIGIEHGSWDTHFDNFASLETALAPHADMALSALVVDLQQRGLLDDTLVIMMGEMGRTPRINASAGRDHWSNCQTVVVAGGGTRPGVIGASDATAAFPTTTPLSIHDLLRTFLGQMGIDCDKVYKTPLGRPVPIVNGGKVIKELV